MDSLSSFSGLNLADTSFRISDKEEADDNVDFKTQVAQHFVLNNGIGYLYNIQDVKTVCLSVIEKKVEEYCQNIFKEIQERALKNQLSLKSNLDRWDFESETVSAFGKVKYLDRLVCAYMREHYDIAVKTAGEKIEFTWDEMNKYVYSKPVVELPRLEEENKYLIGFQRLRNKNQHTDFTFIINDSEKGTQERKVHKALFAIRVPGFEKPMELDDMHLDNITIEAFDLFLNYIYGKKDVSFDFKYTSLQAIESLLNFMANYPDLKLDELKQVCEWALIEKLNQKTVNEKDFKFISKMAEIYELKILRKNCQLIELKGENSFLFGIKNLQVNDQTEKAKEDSNSAMRRTKEKSFRHNKPY